MGTEAEDRQDFTDGRIKHLEMIQAVIARMANFSAWMKRLAIIVVGGAVALAVRDDSAAIALPAFVGALAVVFWLMDARYHQQERWFRALFDEVRKEAPCYRPDFRMDPSAEIRSVSNFRRSTFSWSSGPYYGALVVFLLLAWGFGS